MLTILLKAAKPTVLAETLHLLEFIWIENMWVMVPHTILPTAKLAELSYQAKVINSC
jgi:hypothetical protein